MMWFQSVIYGFISGFSEFSPISSQAHQSLMLYIMGKDGRIHLIDFLTHLGMLLAIIVCGHKLLNRFHREHLVSKRMRHLRHSHVSIASTYDVKVVRTAFFPMILGLLFYGILFHKEQNLLFLTCFLIVNGFILFFTNMVHQGSKDARSFSALDSVGIGVFGALAAVPGISRVGSTASFAIYRGAEKQTAYSWALLLSIPAMILLVIFDLIGLAASGFAGISVSSLLVSFLAMVASFLGSCTAISFMRYLMVNIGLAGFALYSWGAAIFTFIIYLLT